MNDCYMGVDVFDLACKCVFTKELGEISVPRGDRSTFKF